jgi:hypothetical protein
MSRRGPGARAVITIVIWALLVGGLVPNVLAQTTPDKSDVVIVLDFSASILQDATNRNRFGAALEGIAARVDETSADLIAGDATVSIVKFATRAVDQPGCADLKLLNSPTTVTQFANCLRSVAAAYRKGLTTALTKSIGVDTNYVAAMEQAAKHLPPDAVRPAMILFTDGKHDVKGVPASQVPIALNRLFGTRTPFALLPVGMGLDPKERAALEAGLLSLKIVRDMPACVSGAVFDWPNVVFQTPDEAGNAVAVALQDATCTFTVEATPTPPPTPTPTPVPTPPPTPMPLPTAPGKPAVEPMNRAVKISVAPGDPALVAGFHFECSGDKGGTWPATADVTSADNPTGQVGDLTNGVEYVCRAFAENATGLSDASPISDAVKPCGSALQCNSLLSPILGVLGLLAILGLLAVIFAFWRDRARGYVVAVVDVVHTANLGHGRRLGISFVRPPHSRYVTEIVADRGPKADIRIRHRRGDRFEVTDKEGHHFTQSGEPIVLVDSLGVRHEVVLRAFATNSAAAVSSRR